MALKLGINDIASLKLGGVNIPSMKKGAVEVFGGGGGGPPAGLKYDTYPDFENYILGLKTRPTPDAYTSTHEYGFNSMADLQSKVETALSATAAGEGRVTHLYQTQNISEATGFNISNTFRTGAKVVVFGDGYNIDCTGDQYHWHLNNKSGANAGGWKAKSEVAEVYYPNTGDPMSYDDTVIRFASALPTGCAIDEIMKVWTPVLTNANTFYDPVGLAQIWCRYAYYQRMGAFKKIKDIQGLEVLVHGPLYDGPQNFFDQCAKSGSYNLYGSIMDATPQAIFLDGLHIHGFSHGENFYTDASREMIWRDCLLEQEEVSITSDPYEFVWCFDGGWENKIVDSVFHSETNSPLPKRYGLYSRFSSGRSSWVNTGNSGSPNTLAGHDGRDTRHIFDSGGGDWAVAVGQSDDFYASRAGFVMEQVAKDLIFSGGDANDHGFHSNTMGAVIDGGQFIEPVEGENGYGRFGGRMCRSIFRDFYLKASEVQYTPGSDIIRWPSTGAGWPIKHAGTWYNRALRCTFEVDEAGHVFTTTGGSVTGPQMIDQSEVIYNSTVSGNVIHRFTHGLGVYGNGSATVDDVYPGRIDCVFSGLVTLGIETGVTIADLWQKATVFCAAEIDYTGRSSIPVTIFNDDSTGVKAYGRIWIKGRSGPAAPTVRANANADITDLVVTEGARPTEVPANVATFTATGVNNDQINLAWTKGAGDREAGFYIEWSADGSVPWMPLTRVGPNTLAYSHTGLTASTTYYYRIKAVNHLGGSASWATDNDATLANPANQPPVAVADTAQVDNDETVTIDVLANDSDPDADPLTLASLDTTGTSGTVTITSNQALYDPNGQFDSLAIGATDTDTFVYTVSDGQGGSDTASVVVTITPDTVPDDLNNLIIWLDADDPTTITDTGSDGDLDNWADKSTFSNDAYQATSGYQPLITANGINSRTAIEFDGSDDILDMANAAEINSSGPYYTKTIMFAIRTGSDVTSRQVIMEEGGLTRGLNTYIYNGQLYVMGWNLPENTWGPKWVNTAVSANTTYIVTFAFDQPNGQIRGYLNGTLFGTATGVGQLNGHTAAIGIGGMRSDTNFHDGDQSGSYGYHFDGMIGEIVYYQDMLTSAELLAIHSYLLGKWT